MNGATVAPHGRVGREYAVFAATSLALILAQSITFASFGIVLFAMSASHGWSASDAGFAYTIVIAGACVAAPLPVMLIRWIGGALTIVLGQVVLCAAFAILYAASGLGQIYLAALLSGIGFSLSANTPGVYLLSGWAGVRASRLIGSYMMIGMLGNAVGPPAAQALIDGLGWRGYSAVASLAAAAVALLCWLSLREPPLPDIATGVRPPWRDLGRVLRSPIFLTLAAAIVVSQATIVTVASIAPAHLARQGLSAAFTARTLGIEGIASALATGLMGYAVRFVAARRVLPIALVLGAAGMVILAVSRDPVALLAFAILVGASVGGVTLAVTLLLVRYFGSVQGASALGAVWTLAGLAAAGPWVAGLVADSVGSYAPALVGIGMILLPIALCGLLLLPTEDLQPLRERAARRLAP